MNGYISNIENDAEENDNFRKVVFTTTLSQLVLMSLGVGEEIGMEVHKGDQFIRIEDGQVKFVLDGDEFEAEDDWAAVIPAGTQHNVINIGDKPVKLYSIYSSPQHKDGTIHKTKEEADAEE